jgi:hypothetical protein
MKCWRSGRGVWWLRLTSAGFAVNDRVLRPRRYTWGEIDTFMLVNGAFVSFFFPPQRRRTVWHRLRRAIGPRSGDGRKPDGILVGYWDRPFDEAVELMNEWQARYRAA